MSDDIEALRAAQDEAVAAGDSEAANAAYTSLLDALEKQQADHDGVEESPSEVAGLYAELEGEFDSEDVAMLRADWGGEASEIARKSGYTYDITGAQRAAQKESNMTTGISRERLAEGRRHFNERIEQAAAEGNTALRDQIYAEQLDWLDRIQGDNRIVGSGGRIA